MPDPDDELTTEPLARIPQEELDEATTEPLTAIPPDESATEPLPPAYVPRTGEIVAERYRVERAIGGGGFGVVLAVTDVAQGTPYALKCLLPESAANRVMVERFMREAHAAGRIESEHIARVFELGLLPNGAPYILMEYLIGHDLGEIVRQRGPLSIGEAVAFLLQACAAIQKAHALGIVHRDLKPANLFLTQRADGAPLVKVLDFGLSKEPDVYAANAPRLTETGSVFGSPAYMSPEQLRSAKHVDARTDVWALGVILFELLTGNLPFNAQSVGVLLAAIAAEEPTDLRSYRNDVGDELPVVVRRCLEKDPRNRFQSVAELVSALAPFRPLPPRPEPPLPDYARVLLLVLGLVIALALAALYAATR